MITKYLLIPSVFISLAVLMSCSKNGGNNQPGTLELSYGDSVFYVRNLANDYIISPLVNRKGTYTGFPEGIEIDNNSGEINISKSESGLRYKISFLADGSSDTLTTFIVISGINYFDKIYNLSANDTLALPVYNASLTRAIPGTDGTSLFDDGGGCNGAGIAVSSNNGKINLAETLRNGTFGSTPANGAQKEVELRYRLNDPSQKALNALKVKLYYFNTADDITPDLKQLLQDREGTILMAAASSTASIALPGVNSNARLTKVAKPRPPCIFIVGR